MAVLETLRTKFGMAVTILVALGLLSFIIDPSSLETAYHAMSSKYDVGEIDGKSISYNDFQAEMDHYKDISQLLSGSSAESSQQQAQIRNRQPGLINAVQPLNRSHITGTEGAAVAV